MRLFVYFLFCLSGAVALVYESLWSRYLQLFLGHSSYGQIITLVTFMGGLGLGSFLAAKTLGRVRHPFRAYARIELLAALCGFGFHPAYQALTRWFFDQAAMLQSIGPWAADATQIGLCLALTLPFATLLGMTFPLLATGMIRSFPDGGKASLPTLYFANSIGGAAGILLASYWLISKFGTHGSLQIAALGNAAIAAGFYLVHQGRSRMLSQSTDRAAPSPSTRRRPPALPAEPRPRVALFLFIAAGTGLASFIYEVGWIRLLSLILGSSTHSFDAMISAFILGLAFGGLFARRLIRRFAENIGPVLGVIQVLMGSFAVLSLYLYRPFFEIIQASHEVFAKTEAAFPFYAVFKYGLALALMFPAAFCAGMTLPLITWHLLRTTGRESVTGLVYGWNTLGSIAGAVLAGLLLMPLLQLKWTIFSGAALDILLGLILLLPLGARSLKGGGRGLGLSLSRLPLSVGATVLAAAVLLPAFWTRFDPDVLVSGRFRDRAFSSTPPTTLAIRHGKTATISVGRAGKNLFIATNGKSDGAILDPAELGELKRSGDEGTVAELAILPMLTRDSEYDAAIIGMGTGMTGHYLLADDALRSLDLIEIEEAVVDLARWFRPRNERLWHDERLNLVIDDAKRHFYAHRKEYDVIISEPSNPWVSGVASLFTVEFYDHIRHFLKPGGVLVQWVHGYEFRDDLFVSILSALDTFPHVEIYRVHENAGDFIVLASMEPLTFVSSETLAARSRVDEDLAPLGRVIDQFGPGNFMASTRTLKPILDEFRPLTNSDYFPYVEQQAETAFYTRAQVELPAALTFAFSGYPQLLEPDRIDQARQVTRRTDQEIEQDRNSESARELRSLLRGGGSEETDWARVEKLLLTATAHSAGTEAWLDHPLVSLMCDAVEAEQVKSSVALRFTLLQAIAAGDDEATAAALFPAVEASEADVKREPFWIRTFLVAGIRLDQAKPVGRIMVEGVHENPRIGADERVLINELVNRVISFNPDQLAAESIEP